MPRYSPHRVLCAAFLICLLGTPATAECPEPLPASFEEPELLIARAESWLREGNLACAEALAAAVAEHHPGSGEALALLGRARVLQRKHRSAEEPLHRAVELGRRDLRTLLYLGATLWENAKPAEAEKIFREAVAASGRHPAPLEQLGRLLLWQGRFAEAAETLAEAVAKSSPTAGLALDLARALDGAGRGEEALAVYRRALELAPDLAPAHYGLAQLLDRLGRSAEAERAMSEYRRLYQQGQELTRREGLERAETRALRDLWPALEPEPPAPPASSTTVCEGVVLTEIAAAAGLDFRHATGSAGARHLPETMGSGLAWLDFDGDGWLDLYLVQSGPYPGRGGPEAANRLYRNLGVGEEGRLRFEAVSASGAEDRGYGQGTVAADVDGDGDTDLYVANDGPDALYLNRGDGLFRDATRESGLGVEGWSSSAAFADADGDGDLDLYVARYVDYRPDHGLDCADPATGRPKPCDPSLFLGIDDRFYLNLGISADGTPRFRDATVAAGIAPADGRGLGVVFTDLDDDGRPDVYVANDLTINFLFHNLGPGENGQPRFEDLSLFSGAAVNRAGKPEAGMGLAIGDVDGDLDPDLAVTNFDVETNTLYRNLGQVAFEDVSAASGFGPPSFNLLGFGVVFADLDRNGTLDVYVANGHIFDVPPRENVAFRQPPLVLLGDGAGGFRELRCAGLEAHKNVARGLAAADVDNDGDPDLALQDSGGPVSLLRNDVTVGNWLGVVLRGSPPNTGAVGARVVLTTDRRRQVRWVLAGESYQSSGDPRLLFGLDAGERAIELEIRWPSGKRRVLVSPPPGRYLQIEETVSTKP